MASVCTDGDVVAKRRDVLGALSTRKAKPELVDELDVSRSTVDRAIEALLDHGFVERRGSEYVATYAGRAAVAAYDGFLRRLDGLGAAQSVLSKLPPDVAIPPVVFDGATVHESTPEAPERPIEESLDLVKGATSLRGTAPAILSRYIEVFHTLVEDGTDIELVLTESVVDRLADTYPDGFATLKARAAITLHETVESLPYGVWTAERPAGPVSGLVVYGEYGLAGIVSNDTEAMNEWAAEQYAAIRDGAERLD